MKRIYFIAIILFATVSAFATNVQKLDTAHEDFTCADCHKTDSPTKRPKMSECLECHESYQVLAERTKSFSPNPHDSHQGELRCSLCHKPHSQDTLYCNQCHDLQIYKFK